MNRFLNMKQVMGVEVFQRGGQTFYHFIMLKLVKGQMDIISQEEDIESWDALKERLDKSLPLVLVLNVRGILHKKVDQQLTDQQLISSVLPNARTEDFYNQTIDIYDQKVVSLIRKDQLEQWTAPFFKDKYWLLDIRLGSFDIGQLLPFIRQEAVIHTSTHDLEINDQQIFSFQKNKEETPQNVLLGDKYIETRLLTAVGGAFRMLVQSPINEIASPQLVETKKDFVQFKLFETVGWTVLMTFLFLLLGNYMAFTHFSKKNQQMSAQLIYKQQKLDHLDSLKSAYEKQAALFKENNLTKLSRVSYYADRIAATIPNDIKLTHLSINPYQKPKRGILEENALPTFLQNQIHINGQTTSSISFNRWKEQLQKFGWISQIDQLQYQELNGSGEFEIVVFVNEE